MTQAKRACTFLISFLFLCIYHLTTSLNPKNQKRGWWVGWDWVGRMHFGIQTLIPEQANTLWRTSRTTVALAGSQGASAGTPTVLVSTLGPIFQFLLLIAPVVERGKKVLVLATIFSLFFFLSGSLTDWMTDWRIACRLLFLCWFVFLFFVVFLGGSECIGMEKTKGFTELR